MSLFSEVDNFGQSYHEWKDVEVGKVNVKDYARLQEDARATANGHGPFSEAVKTYPYSRHGVNHVSELGTK